MELYLTNYNNFVEQLKMLFKDENILQILDANLLLDNNTKIEKGKIFTKKINEFDFNSFYNCKIKVFSHKNEKTMELSQIFFGEELCIKNLLNNQPEEIKNIIWNHLHNIWYYTECMEESNNENIILMKKKLFGENNLSLIKVDARKKLQELLGVELNYETSEMIDDIINSFESLFNDSNENPLSNIVKISQTISNKYSNKIKNGNIEIEKIMEAILGKLPGMENMFGKFKNMKTIFEKPKKCETVIIDENFSTANVALGEIPEDQEPSMKIGSILKIADKFGIIPGASNASSTSSASENPTNILDSLSSNLLNINLNGLDGLEGLDKGNGSNEENGSNMLNLDKMMNLLKIYKIQII